MLETMKEIWLDLRLLGFGWVNFLSKQQKRFKRLRFLIKFCLSRTFNFHTHVCIICWWRTRIFDITRTWHVAVCRWWSRRCVETQSSKDTFVNIWPTGWEIRSLWVMSRIRNVQGKRLIPGLLHVLKAARMPVDTFVVFLHVWIISNIDGVTVCTTTTPVVTKWSPLRS